MHCKAPLKRSYSGIECHNAIYREDMARVGDDSSSCSVTAALPPAKVSRLCNRSSPAAAKHVTGFCQQPCAHITVVSMPESTMLQQQSSQIPSTGTTRKQVLLQLLHLVRFIQAAGKPSQLQAAAGCSQQALPATLAAANSCLAAVHAAVQLVNSIVEQPATTADMADRALRVAEAALAATQLNISQARNLALQQQAAAAQHSSSEEEELADTCCSSCRW